MRRALHNARLYTTFIYFVKRAPLKVHMSRNEIDQPGEGLVNFEHGTDMRVDRAGCRALHGSLGSDALAVGRLKHLTECR